MMRFKQKLEDNPIVAAVKDMQQLDKALQADVNVIFVLFGNVLDIVSISKKISNSNKIGILHIDLVDGLTNREVALQYLKEKTTFNGIISTKPQTIKTAKRLGLIAIQRVFILDSLSLNNVQNHLIDECDAVEMLPGLLFKVITKLSTTLNKPLIVGGLISDKEDVMGALKAGATCISTTRESIWDM
ncbi:glycerol-3-phosphate responsive antiterminator [uncultured Clostridium sp.]|uniref:glycerol-3-phosphate responsive antiterminator n=1 Tax=uncultured Clostridium sp. TaxID=59620 RepID=UPI00263151B8|nr:glycerol-3-phosphate responsive antiterminator [uncultured Clostridium sp.]